MMPQRNQEKDSNSGVNLVEIWGSWIRVKKISISTGKFPKNLNFFRQFYKRISSFAGKFPKILIFSGNKKIDFPSQKKSIYSYLWANYSISLQKSPLSNILPCT